MKRILLVFIMLLGFNVSAVAEEISTINDSSHLNKGEYDSLKINGFHTFNDLIIKNLLVTNGSIQGKNLKCKIVKSNGFFDVNGLQAQNVESNGSFVGENIDITGDSVFKGGLKVTNGKLNNIKVATTRATLINSEVTGNILFKKVNNDGNFLDFKTNQSSAEILELKGKSIVMGDITFEDTGEVHIFDGSEVKGKIFNAKVIQK